MKKLEWLLVTTLQLMRCKRFNVVTVAANRIQVYCLVGVYFLRLETYYVSFPSATQSHILLSGQRVHQLI